MNYYNEIKKELINNEIYKKVKNYSINRSDLFAYYNVGKILSEVGKHYGESIIKTYSKKLINEVSKKYNETNLKRMRQFYWKVEKGATMWHQLSWSHYRLLITLKSIEAINYYGKTAIENLYSVRQLEDKIKNKEYERLDEVIKDKLVNKQTETRIDDFIKHPIIIKNKHNYELISESILKQLILEDISSFLKELGHGFTFIEEEYKIRLGDRYNYIDLLLYNIKFKCYVVIELKITELKKEYIGQIQTYMKYIDKNVKSFDEDKTIGIIICKKDNHFIMEYCSDERIYRTTYEIK